MIDLHHFFGDAPGPRILMLGGVHGEERPGTLALDALAAELNAGRLKLLKGELLVAPRVNGPACAQNAHFIDENLNRIVRYHAAPTTNEQMVANDLIPLLDAADAVLDLHGTTAPTVPFAFLDDESTENRAWADAIGAPFLLSGWPSLYLGAGTVTTTEYAHAKGKRSLTVEVGQNDDLASADLGLSFARRTLAHFGLIASLEAVARPSVLRLSKVIRRERDGAFARDWKNFDAVKKGEALICWADGETLSSPVDGFVVMPYAGAAPDEEWLYLAVTA